MSDIKAHLFPFSKEGDQYETKFNGRQLIGHSVSVQGTTQGHVWVKETGYEEEEEEEEEYKQATWKKTNTTIDEFILWKKDRAPDKQDYRIKALENWLDISQSIHEPIPL
ncbi:unnamed protein product [Rhizopus stolonifer]